VNDRGFALSGPKYFDRFLSVCQQMITDNNVNFFKFDGIAEGIGASGVSGEYFADIHALVRLVHLLRRTKVHS
jgi:hypothetical protein